MPSAPLGFNWRVRWADGFCPYCDRRFRGAIGVRVHIAASHCDSTNPVVDAPVASESLASGLSSSVPDNSLASSERTTPLPTPLIPSSVSTPPIGALVSAAPPCLHDVPPVSATASPVPKTSFSSFPAPEAPLPRVCSPPLTSSQTVPKQLVTSTDVDYSNWREQWADGVCPFCSKTFNGAQGVRVHISNSHQQQSQDMKLSRRERKQAYRRPPRAPRPVSTRSVSPESVSRAASPALTPDDSSAASPGLPSLAPWVSIFEDLLSRSPEADISTEFDEQVQACVTFLADSIHKLKGPKHPSTKYYEARRAGRARCHQAGHSRSTNPMRSDKRKKAKARARFDYELAQFQYYNIRKRAVNSVLNPTRKDTCTIPKGVVEDHFTSTLGEPNDCLADSYLPAAAPETVDPDSDVISEGDIRDAMRGMSADTSPGPDNVLLRVVRTLRCEKLLSLMATIMYSRSLVPQSFLVGRTVLIGKGGDPSVVQNWRPITIFSVLRRIIERVLDSRLRSRVQFHSAQRGFVNVPGTHINSSIINGVLRSAKRRRNDCVVVFLDISKAFDNIGHDHLRRTLEGLPIPEKLRDIILLLCQGNTIQVQVGREKTKPIPVRCGVAQGAPLSPTLFNLCIDFLLRELTEDSITREHGYHLVDGLPGLTAMAFADDLALIAKDLASARRLASLANRCLRSIGLSVNFSKSSAIVIKAGKLDHSSSGVSLDDSDVPVPTLGPSDRIRYLGVDFQAEIVLDEAKVLRELKTKVDLITSSPLLHPDQKLEIFNQFVWPSLIYPLQTAPLHELKSGFLEDVDFLIRGAVKQICSLPMDTPTSMLYSPRPSRGLGLFRASWEAFLQHVNIARKLETSQDPHLPECRDLQQEQAACLKKLRLQPPVDESSSVFPPSPPSAVIPVRALRRQLREREFSAWCSLPSKGQGVEVFSDFPAANRWVTKKSGLSSSEWTNALKMSTNNCSLRSNPRTASGTTHCRHCSEPETLAHVLGACPRGELLRNRRHHRVCDTIAEALRARGHQASREFHVNTDEGSRFLDLLVISPDGASGLVLDPTVRFERSAEQARAVDEEKRQHYLSSLPILRIQFPAVKDWQIFGLMFGARGALPTLTVDILRGLGLKTAFLQPLALDLLRDSLGILNHHMYSRQRE